MWIFQLNFSEIQCCLSITLQAVADEKRKKQDDKLRKAQQAREANEREKVEKQRKQLQVNKQF